MIHELFDYVRREAQNAVAMREMKGTLLCTAYNPKTHAIKGILMPHEVETGWVPISVAGAGNGFGVLVGPKVGDASKAADGFDGDVFDVEFDGGDPNTPVAKLKHFSATQTPPEVQSGEILIKHEKGGSRLYAADGSITDTHPSGATITWDKDGNHIHDNRGKDITVKTAGTYTQATKTGDLA